MSFAYYNENNQYCAQWLRNLIAAGHIAAGEVDGRSIEAVSGLDLTGFRQVHLFAGIGVWSLALQMAGWPEDREIWSGSCPCQPFSLAGKRKGVEDDRNLWPEFSRLVRECRPDTIIGEQVASPDGRAWFDVVSADLETLDYACGAADLCAAGIGAPHIRQRLFWVANTMQPGRAARGAESRRGPATGSGNAGGVADGNGPRLAFGKIESPRTERTSIERSGLIGRVGITDSTRRDARRETAAPTRQRNPPIATGCWSEIEWLACRDGKHRPAKPGIFPLAHGPACRVEQLRAYGNAIAAPLAAEFIKAVMDCLP